MADRVRRDGITIDGGTGEVDPMLPEAEKVDDMNRGDQWRHDLEIKYDQINRLNELTDRTVKLSSEVVEISKQLLSFGFPAGAIIDDLVIVKDCGKAVKVQSVLIGALKLSSELVMEKLKSALDEYPDGISALELLDLKLKYLPYSDDRPNRADPDSGTKKKSTPKKKAVTKKKTAKKV